MAQINDPDPDIITNERYEFYTERTKQFGAIPKLRFKPNGCQIKAEIIESAGLKDESNSQKKAEIRAKLGIKKAINKDAKLFESEWNNLMHKFKLAATTLGIANQTFATSSQAVSEPIQLLQGIVMEEHADKIKAQEAIPDKKTSNSDESEGIRSYIDELAELE